MSQVSPRSPAGPVRASRSVGQHHQQRSLPGQPGASQKNSASQNGGPGRSALGGGPSCVSCCEQLLRGSAGLWPCLGGNRGAFGVCLACLSMSRQRRPPKPGKADGACLLAHATSRRPGKGNRVLPQGTPPPPSLMAFAAGCGHPGARPCC